MAYSRLLDTLIQYHYLYNPIEVIRVFKWTNNKGVCNMIHTRTSFHSLSCGYLPQPTHMKFIKQVIKAIQRKWWKDLRFPFKMADYR